VPRFLSGFVTQIDKTSLVVDNGSVMRLDRLLSIVITLLNNDRISAAKLAAKHEVTIRTIYRDLEAIHAAGIPVVAYPGNAGGYGIMENFVLNRQLLSLQDMGMIITALKGMKTSLPTPETESAIAKLGSLVPRDKQNRIAEFGERIAVDMTGWYFDEKRKLIVGKLYEAVNANRLVCFVYRNLKGEETTRTVEPMTLLYKGSSWYLLGYCRRRGAFRMFHIGRMRDVELKLTTFKRRPFSQRDFFNGEFKSQKSISLVLRFPIDFRIKVEEFYPPESVQEKDGFLYVSSRLPEDEWLYGMILSWGDRCEVVEPQAVRKRIKSIVNKMADRYQT
jgi:predicted DNA-binding transcriptional regulator YafY